MLVLNSASTSGISYWQRDAVRSYWLGAGAAALGLEGQVRPDDLAAVLRGQSPGGPALTPRPGLRRRQGWDVVIAAPKSFSMLASAACAASAGLESAGPALEGAFSSAVVDTVGLLENRASYVSAQGGRRSAPAVVAAAFEHRHSDAGQAHFHSHVVLANLAARDGPGEGKYSWGCLVGDELWRWREALGAAFHMSLRDHLARAGLAFSWELRPGGLGEIAEVPPLARRAASARSVQIDNEVKDFGSLSARARAVAQGVTRASPGAQGRQGPDGAQGPGWGDDQARAVLRRALRPGPPAGPLPSAGAVSKALARRATRYNEADLMVAMAEASPAGLGVVSATTWAGHWAAGSQDEMGAQARLFDARVADAVRHGRHARLAQVSPLLAGKELDELCASPAATSAALALTLSGHGVDIVPRGPWTEQAEVVDAARCVWQAAGVKVELATPTPLSGRRWRALTSLTPVEPGTAGGGSGRPRGERAGPRALVVDAAGHLSPAALAQLVEQAERSETKLVLVMGGTVPGRAPALSDALEALVAPGAARPGLPPQLPAPAPAWPHCAFSDQCSSPLHGALSGAQSMAHLVSSWAGRCEPGVLGPLMVALGPAEAEALNHWARHALGLASGPRAGTELTFGPRSYVPGEPVLALRRLGQAPAGCQGRVEGLTSSGLSVGWQRGANRWSATVGAADAKALGHGYATTLPYLRSAGQDRALMVLGRPSDLGRYQGQCVGAWVTLSGSGLPSFGPTGRDVRRRQARAELAEIAQRAQLSAVRQPRQVATSLGRGRELSLEVGPPRV